MKLEVKEKASLEKRLWVRLTRLCNNRCLFCLDSQAQNGTIVSSEEITEKIRTGCEKGAQRLILSGGEPTIHPDLLKFVELGKKLNFDWIQIITNGRMFSYADFAQKTVIKGVNEVTISIHGHNERLHDRLTGVHGAFRQAVAGLKNLFRTGKCVVNIDVVVNRMNYMHIPEIIEYFYGLGIREFDILHLIPHGRGFDENRKRLFFDMSLAYPYLKKAFEIRKRQGVFMWTNRMPARYLEGAEDLIQDPHKIYDEVFGEREIFRELLEKGKMPLCRGEKCKYCFIEDYCARILAVYQALKDQKITEKKTIKKQTLLFSVKNIKKIESNIAAKRLKGSRADHELQVEIPNYETLSETFELVPSLEKINDFADRTGLRVLNFPVCLHPRGISSVPEFTASPQILSEDGNLDLLKFTIDFISNHYYVKSLRCRKCRFERKCRGIHINFARRFGLGILKPFSVRS
jgi:MoaA/NifB/PqqE/SkfB family radical SAM enzyme